MTEPAMELLGQIMSASVAAQARTTNQIEAMLRADIARLCVVIGNTATILDGAMVIDRATEERLQRCFWPHVHSTERLLDSTREMQVKYDGVERREGWRSS